MDLTFTPEAQKQVERYLRPNTKLLLDFDDGVGPFSNLGNCSMDSHYKLIFVKDDLELPDFDQSFPSNLGPVYYKGYNAPQYEAGMQLQFNKRYFTLPLVSPSSVLTDDVELVDAYDFQPQATQQSVSHDC